MLNNEIYENSLKNYLDAYPNSDENEYVIGNLFKLRARRLNILALSEFRLQEMYFEEHKKGVDPDYADIIKWGDNFKKRETELIDRQIKFYQVRHGRLNNVLPSNVVKDSSFSKQGLKWLGTALELSELLKALIESEKLEGKSEKEIFRVIFELFGLKFTKEIKKNRLDNIGKRLIDKTKFLDSLNSNLVNWIDKKDN